LTLPSEITSEIFTHFLPAYPKHCQLVSPDSPSHLSRICRAWRNVAVSTPTLWNAIELNIHDPELHEHQLPLPKTRLTRSGGCPLCIALLCRYDTQISTTVFVEAIVCHTSRRQEIELLLPYEDLRHITGVMPLLRILTLGPTMELEESTPVATPVVLFIQAPNLREATLSSYFNPFCITLSWPQITKLTAGLYNIEATAILRDATALEECRLTLFSEFSAPIPPIPPLTRLWSLVLSASSSGLQRQVVSSSQR
ncbi:hypothetical protein DFH07DRAFT_763422, partial [Mycena maculata]